MTLTRPFSRALDLNSSSSPGRTVRSFIERCEALQVQRKDLAEEQKEVRAEAKGQGYDPKILKRIISLRKQDKATRDEADAILTTYMDALGMN